ncbi:MAG: hypothetical protein FWF23_02275 [Alphaproteobacteria bacterium]|nr:hypothetical protein [Alphaproteobacteria bacterium]MCL2504813.1 hypothetical protein [Alphaproteobacteria bacterium]
MSNFQEDSNNTSVLKQSNNVTPTKERYKHNGGVKEEVIAYDTEGNPVAVRYKAVWECALDVYRDFGLLNNKEHKTGIEFRRVYHDAASARNIDILPTTEVQALEEPTKSETKLKQAYTALPSAEREVVVAVCGNNFHIRSMSAHEKLRKGLGHLAIAWHSAAIEITETPNFITKLED